MSATLGDRARKDISFGRGWSLKGIGEHSYAGASHARYHPYDYIRSKVENVNKASM